MDADLQRFNPLRPLAWRADSALDLVSHQFKPLRRSWHADHYIRDYYRLLLLIDSGCADERLDASPKLKAAYGAHQIRFGGDAERRAILEARLLTEESFAQIARRSDMDTAIIEYYEALFFRVRDRLHNQDWIRIVALRPPNDGSLNECGDLSSDMLAYVYRFLAYHGGPLALDAILSGGDSERSPQRPDEANKWFDDRLKGTILARTIAAIITETTDSKNGMRLIKLALRMQHNRTVSDSETSEAERNRRLFVALQQMNPAAGKGNSTLGSRIDPKG